MSSLYKDTIFRYRHKMPGVDMQANYARNGVVYQKKIKNFFLFL